MTKDELRARADAHLERWHKQKLRVDKLAKAIQVLTEKDEDEFADAIDILAKALTREDIILKDIREEMDINVTIRRNDP